MSAWVPLAVLIVIMLGLLVAGLRVVYKFDLNRWGAGFLLTGMLAFGAIIGQGLLPDASDSTASPPPHVPPSVSLTPGEVTQSSGSASPSTASQPIIASYNPSFDGQPECEIFTMSKVVFAKLPSERAGLTPDWVYGHGGASATSMAGTVILEGDADRAIVVTKVETVDVGKEIVPPGLVNVSKCKPGGGNGLPSRDFAVKFKGSAGVVTPFAEGTPFKVTKESPERLGFVISSEQTAFYKYRLKLSWVLAGQDGHLTIDRDGSEFRAATGTGQLPLYVWEEGAPRPVMWNN